MCKHIELQIEWACEGRAKFAWILSEISIFSTGKFPAKNCAKKFAKKNPCKKNVRQW